MLEAQWQSCAEPAKMMSEFALCEHQRKTRLLLIAHCRREWDRLSETSQKAVAIAEKYADGEAPDATLAKAEQAAAIEAMARDKALNSAMEHLQMGSLPEPVGLPPAVIAKLQGDVNALKAKLAAAMFAHAASYPHYSVMESFPWHLDPASKEPDAALIRDIFGNPFRPLTFTRSWRSETVVQLAKRMYEENDFKGMKALGLALQAAGCENPDVLANVRSDTPHVRGNWVVDMILGKE